MALTNDNVLRPFLLCVNTGLGYVSGLYKSRVTLMVQGLVFYWLGSICFKRCSLWEIFVLHHPTISKYGFTSFWTIDFSVLIVAIVLVTVAWFLDEETVKKMFNIRGKIGINFYRVGKSIGEISMLRLMVLVGDKTTDPTVAEIEIAMFFGCFYLSIVSLFKLCHVGNDLGFLDGVAALVLSIITHYAKSGNQRFYALVFTGIIIWAKNVISGECCAACSRAAEVVVNLPPGDGGGSGGVDSLGGGSGGVDSRGGGNDGLGGFMGGGRVRHRGGSSQSVDFTSIDMSKEDVFHSARHSLSEMKPPARVIKPSKE